MSKKTKVALLYAAMPVVFPLIGVAVAYGFRFILSTRASIVLAFIVVGLLSYMGAISLCNYITYIERTKR